MDSKTIDFALLVANRVGAQEVELEIATTTSGTGQKLKTY